MTDALEFAGGRRFLRKVLLASVRRMHSLAVLADGALVAIALFQVRGAGWAEFGMFVNPPAGRRMTGLVRLTHLTLSAMADDGVKLMCRVRESDPRARRMARIAGFEPAMLADRSIWIYRRPAHERLDRQFHRRQRQARQKTGGAAAPPRSGGAGAPALDPGERDGADVAGAAEPARAKAVRR
jgi:hypothetical protein